MHNANKRIYILFQYITHDKIYDFVTNIQGSLQGVNSPVYSKIM